MTIEEKLIVTLIFELQQHFTYWTFKESWGIACTYSCRFEHTNGTVLYYSKGSDGKHITIDSKYTVFDQNLIKACENFIARKNNEYAITVSRKRDAELNKVLKRFKNENQD